MIRSALLACCQTSSRLTQRSLSASSSTHSLKKSPLHELHQKHKGKMVPFMGYELPFDYEQNTVDFSVLHTRRLVSLFDRSHAVQVEITGKHRESFLESFTPSDIKYLENGRATHTIFTNERGGIRADGLATKQGETLFLIVYGGSIERQLQEGAATWKRKGKDVEVKMIEDRALLTIQGSKVLPLLEDICNPFPDRFLYGARDAEIFGIGCHFTRTSFSGEDGGDISVPKKDAMKLAEMLLNFPFIDVQLAGLGAREVLRVETGLFHQYGVDIDENTTPIEAGIDEAFNSKRRREAADFPGADRILSQLKQQNSPKVRVGIKGVPSDDAPALRSHIPLIDPLDKAAIGFVTSGCFSPSLQSNIAIAYVDRPYMKIGTEFIADFGNEQLRVEVDALPFMIPNFYKNILKQRWDND